MWGESYHAGYGKAIAVMLGQSRAEATQQRDKDEGAQAGHPPDLVLDHAPLPLCAYERAYEQGHYEGIDVRKVHYGISFDYTVNRLCIAATIK